MRRNHALTEDEISILGSDYYGHFSDLEPSAPFPNDRAETPTAYVRLVAEKKRDKDVYELRFEREHLVEVDSDPAQKKGFFSSLFLRHSSEKKLEWQQQPNKPLKGQYSLADAHYLIQLFIDDKQEKHHRQMEIDYGQDFVGFAAAPPSLSKDYRRNNEMLSSCKSWKDAIELINSAKKAPRPGRTLEAG